jgi:hypothetical protein
VSAAEVSGSFDVSFVEGPTAPDGGPPPIEHVHGQFTAPSCVYTAPPVDPLKCQ